jgi:hypothetical protein
MLAALSMLAPRRSLPGKNSCRLSPMNRIVPEMNAIAAEVSARDS